MIFVIVLIITTVTWICCALIKDKFSYDWELIYDCILVGFTVILVFMALVFFGFKIEENSATAANQEIYKSLCYQVEHKMWEDDVNVSKKQLVDQITSWNKDFAYRKNLESNIWIGVFLPDIYKDTDIISLEGVK